MYEKFNIVGDLLEKAKVCVLNNDRVNFNLVFEAAEEYCRENKVLVGGAAGIEILTNTPINKDSYFYPLYTENAFQDAKGLSIAICKKILSIRPLSTKDQPPISPEVDPRSIVMETNLTHKEFTIFINGRIAFKIYRLDRYRGVRLYELIDPVEITGRFIRGALQVISPEIYLMDIYRKLYLPYADKPGGYKSYTFYRQLEQTLFPEAFKYSEKLLTIKAKPRPGYKGGTEDGLVIGGSQEFNGGAATINISHGEFDKVIIRDFISSGEHILIGDHAMGKANGRLQFITAMEIGAITKIIENVAKASIGDNKIVAVTYNLGVIDDFQLKKYTIYANNNRGDSVALADIFNSTAYELVPFVVRKGIKIGNPYVLLRFKMIDLWALKLILNLGSCDEKFIHGKIKEVLDDIQTLRKTTDDVDGLFQLRNYLGVYIDEDIAKKKLIAAEREKIQHKRFYPITAI